MIAFTFDDSFKTDLTVGLQKQLDLGIKPKGTSYVITSPTYRNPGRLSAEDMIHMINLGWDIQCHTHTHPVGAGGLTVYTAEQLYQEMQNVNTFFNDELGIPAPEHHAYPGGSSNDLVVNVLKRFRKTMRGTQNFIVTDKPDWEQLPIYPYAKGDGYDPKKIVDLCAEKGTSAIFMIHELADPQLRSDYEDLLEYAVNSDVDLVTISELYNRLTRGK